MSARGRIANLQRAQYAENGVVSRVEAARMLGVSPRSVTRFLASGTLSFARIGGRVVLPRQAVLDFLAAQTRIGSVA